MDDKSQDYFYIDFQTDTNGDYISIGKEESKIKSFLYDYGRWGTTQDDIFENCGKKICDDVLKGYNGIILAYDQTVSGKTNTLLGIKKLIIN